MKTIKIISNDRKDLIENVFGDFVNLPEDSNEINSFIYPNEITDQTFYIIEVSPDDKNPLNFNGVKIALQLYFKHLQENKLNFFIRLIGFEKKADIFFDCEYSSFIKCPNVAYQQINLDFKINIPDDINSVDTEIAIDLLKKINIKPPTSYKTHHSISNEWAIYRWSQYLGIKTSLDIEIEKSLYFQYLKTIYQITNIDKKANFLVSDGNLLLIDDEEAKGWSDFFNKLKLPSSALKIESIGKSFKSLNSKDDIIAECQKKIREFKPQTIILDLRLHDSDFEEDNSTELTGFKILKKIKEEINPGIQVILFTASNKVWNYQALNTIGFDGWITKESPVLSVDASFTAKAIKDLKNSISDCFNKKYLCKIYEEKEKLIKNIFSLAHDNFFKEQIKNHINLAYYLLSKADKKEQFAYAFVSLYMIIEIINNQFVVKTSNDNWVINITNENLLDWLYDKNTNSYINTNTQVYGNKPPEWQKLAGLYYQSWNGQELNFIQKLYYLILKRNGFIHNDYEILNKTKKDDKGNNILDNSGKPIFLNHDIYEPQGFINLFEVIKKIISFL